jgi:hypothetical protein
MKTFLKIVVVMLMLHTINANAQRAQPVAVSENGTVIQSAGVREARSQAGFKMPPVDSITVEDARNIYALNLMPADKKNNLSRGKVTGFKMSVYDKAGEHIFESKTEALTPEMKEFLKTIQPGSKLYFEWIRTELPDGSKPAGSPIGFRII